MREFKLYIVIEREGIFIKAIGPGQYIEEIIDKVEAEEKATNGRLREDFPDLYRFITRLMLSKRTEKYRFGTRVIASETDDKMGKTIELCRVYKGYYFRVKNKNDVESGGDIFSLEKDPVLTLQREAYKFLSHYRYAPRIFNRLKSLMERLLFKIRVDIEVVIGVGN